MEVWLITYDLLLPPGVNPVCATGLSFYTPWKHQKTFGFMWCVQGVKKETSSMKWVKGLKGVLKIFKEQSHKIRSIPPNVIWKSYSENILEIPRKSFTTAHVESSLTMLNISLVADVFLGISRNIQNSCFKRKPDDVTYFIKEHPWISAFNEATSKKIVVEVNPPQRWPWKEHATTVVAAVIILEVANNWRSVLQINILKKKRLWTLITFPLWDMLESLVSTQHIC